MTLGVFTGKNEEYAQALKEAERLFFSRCNERAYLLVYIYMP
jgi:hypothetical protein